MIEIRFSDDHTEITAKGHSEYAELGHDIVCASVSSAFIFASELLKNLKVKHVFGSDEKVPFIGIQLAGRKTVGLAVIVSLINTLKLLAEDYPAYVNISCVVVEKPGPSLRVTTDESGQVKVVAD